MRWADLDLTAGYLANRRKQERFGGGGAPRRAGGCDPGGTHEAAQRVSEWVFPGTAAATHLKEPRKGMGS